MPHSIMLCKWKIVSCICHTHVNNHSL
jgi:hypothetical protein